MKQFSKQDYDFDQFKSKLNISGEQRKNNPLYEVVAGVLNGSQFLKDQISTKRGKNDKIDLTDSVVGVLPIGNGGAVGGQYIPDITLVTNITGVGFDSDGLYWTRIGGFVTTFGTLFVTTTAAGLARFKVSLPILSYFRAITQLSGTGIGNQVPETVAIFGDNVNFLADFIWTTATPGVQFLLPFSFSYKVITQQ